MTYFFKSMVFNPIRLACGKRLEWIPVNRSDGVLATEDPDIVQALTSLAGQKRLGVSVLDQASYEDLKKNGVTYSEPQWQPRVNLPEFGSARPPTAAPPPSPAPPVPKPAAAGSKRGKGGARSSAKSVEKPVVNKGVFE